MPMGRSIKFESFTLDLGRLCLLGPTGQVPIRRKSFDVLRYLLEHSGRVITREELSNAVWPDVIVSDEVLTHCIGEVRRAIGDQAQRILKTVPRRGYLMDVPIPAAATEPTESAKTLAAGETLPLALPDRPSIAVLAFANMSGDPAQDYFSDGITEDIITELSRFSELFVIARNSSFQYKGKSIDVRQVGRELGVRYVLEGSIRRAGNRIRISAQLVDAVTGGHRWADRYDRKLDDVFAVQDEVARTIVTLLAAHVNKAEAERTLNKPPAVWHAYDYYMRAADVFGSFRTSFEVEQLYETRRLLERSISMDPNYARAYGLLSWSYLFAWIMPVEADFLIPGTLARAHELARRAVQLDQNLPRAHAHLGCVLTWVRQTDAAIAEFERAAALNPNFTDSRFATALIFAGEPERAIEVIKAHMRLDPFYMPLVPGWLGFAHYMLKRYAEAIPPLRECVSRAPNLRSGHQWLAATYGQLGRLEEARTEAAEVMRIQPTYTINGSQTRLAVFKKAQDAAHFFDGLRKAGLPEK
jgi:adenylate cyclase